MTIKKKPASSATSTRKATVRKQSLKDLSPSAKSDPKGGATAWGASGRICAASR